MDFSESSAWSSPEQTRTTSFPVGVESRRSTIRTLLKLEDLGQVVVDDTSLVYAVMEPIEANLGDVLSEQRLTVPETTQIATSLLSVLGALHSQGFIHGNVHPLHVVAVDEVVKLQCDCIRDAPEGGHRQELKKQDVHDLAVLLLQALTQERTLEAARTASCYPLRSIELCRKE